MFAPQHVPIDFLPTLGREMLVRPGQIRANAEDAAFMVPAAAALQEHHRRLSVPAMIFAGAADKVVDPETHARKLHIELKNSELLVLPGVGHMVHHAALDEVFAAIVSDVQKISGRNRNPMSSAAHKHSA